VGSRCIIGIIVLGFSVSCCGLLIVVVLGFGCVCGGVVVIVLISFIVVFVFAYVLFGY